jgi:hypothetical protein
MEEVGIVSIRFFESVKEEEHHHYPDDRGSKHENLCELPKVYNKR